VRNATRLCRTSKKWPSSNQAAAASRQSDLSMFIVLKGQTNRGTPHGRGMGHALKPNVKRKGLYYNERYRNKALPFWQSIFFTLPPAPA
jgi:hypothetical protein